MAKLRKTHRKSPADEQEQLVRATFFDSMRHLPSAMVEDLLERFAPDAVVSGAQDEVLFDHCDRLADIVDVFGRDYDTGNDPLGTEAWSAIGEITSDYAPELDMGLVTYVMALAVEHHAV